MKKVWNYAMSMWQPVGALAIGGLLIAFLFTYRLGGLTSGISGPEQLTEQQSQSFQNIFDNPINAPYKTAEYLIRHIHNSIAFERLVSGLVAGLAIIMFYILARRLTNRFAAVASTVMFATSSALLHNGRLASPNIMLLVLLLLLVIGYRLRFNGHRTRTWLLAAAIVGIALSTPGMIYFIIGGGIWQYRAVKRSHELPRASTLLICAGIILLLILPLILGLVHHPNLWHDYFLIPRIFPHIKSLLLQILAVPVGVVGFAPKNTLYRLGRQPLLDAFGAIMFVLGLYTLAKRYKLDRLILFIGIFLLGILLTAISGNYEYSFILVPYVYLTVAVGLGVLLDSWRKVFPNNPLARGLAIGVAALAVAASVNFQLLRYFIAWPHNDETKTVFIQR